MLEWLETNGLGSYAASTISGANTRRYHGLLVASLTPPVNRQVLLSRLDDMILDQSDTPYYLSHSIFQEQQGTPESPILLNTFTVLPVPTWVYNLPDDPKNTLTKQLTFHPQRNVVVITYTLSDNTTPLKLMIKPLLVHRDFHALNQDIQPWSFQSIDSGLLFHSDPEMSLYLKWHSKLETISSIQFQLDPQYYQNYWYPRETERGLEDTENLYCPGILQITLQPGESFCLAISPEPMTTEDCTIDILIREKAKQLEVSTTQLPSNPVNTLLLRASQQFIVERQSTQSKTVIAGYPWFNDWGRDTMISLPGLCLYTGNFDQAESILDTFARYIKNGLLPNNFPDQANDEPGYNTLDASLWWFHTVYIYWQESEHAVDATHRYQFVKTQYEALQTVLKHHIYGRHSGQDLLHQNPTLQGLIDPTQCQLIVGRGIDGIGMEADGLIAADNPQLTWMDAAEGPHVFTPRSGKPVEINALWFHAASVMKLLAEYLYAQAPSENQYLEQSTLYNAFAQFIKNSLQRYWHSEKQCLVDLLDSPDVYAGLQIRPNQIFTISLPHRAFCPEQEQAILNCVTQQLLTPYGLRSLSPKDSCYIPYYPLSNSHNRDSAYHQGTVWSWLIGPYIDALLNIKGPSQQTISEAQKLLQPLLDHLAGLIPEHAASGAMLGGISEIFDGTFPHHAKGCNNQAWSVAEVLRQVILLKRYDTQIADFAPAISHNGMAENNAVLLTRG